MRSWKLSRFRSLSINGNTIINNVVNTIDVLDDQYFHQRNHSDEACFYYPVPDPNTPVQFRGRCDDTIPVVPIFNVTSVSRLILYIDLHFHDSHFNNTKGDLINM